MFSRPSKGRWTLFLPDPGRQNFNILDIPLADVTRRTWLYVELDPVKPQLELAAEYLLMYGDADRDKSRMLLPLHKTG